MKGNPVLHSVFRSRSCRPKDEESGDESDSDVDSEIDNEIRSDSARSLCPLIFYCVLSNVSADISSVQVSVNI